MESRRESSSVEARFVSASRDSKVGRRSRISASGSCLRRLARGRMADDAGTEELKTWVGFTEILGWCVSVHSGYLLIMKRQRLTEYEQEHELLSVMAPRDLALYLAIAPSLAKAISLHPAEQAHLYAFVRVQARSIS